jgi:DNA gyrase/topoisomerase IV subunit A
MFGSVPREVNIGQEKEPGAGGNINVPPVRSEKGCGQTDASIHLEVEKRYLAYALSTIVSRALPDVRDGLKPVHRRILYAMHSMRLTDAAKMRKSAAVVGEVIGKYHPHGDQAAYDALVRMAQDFSLRYPLIDGSGNFGSIDGDSPAAMRYTETRLSTFAGMLLRDIDRGTTDFRPTYDAIGEEPDVLPSSVPNLLLNGSSGIAVGMSCSFPPHNLSEVVAACRATIRQTDLRSRDLLKHVKGPDFPTGGEILDHADHLAEIYAGGHGSIRVRGTFQVESLKHGRTNLVVTSVPYSVNKSRLIERMAQLIRDKKLKHVQDVRDESTKDVRIVLELRGGDVKPDSVMAFLYKHTDLQINFPMNFIAITPEGVPERLGLASIIRYFLDFRYDKTVRRLEHTLAILQKRIHVLEGFALVFQDLDKALQIIRSSRSRREAEQGLRDNFPIDDEQIEAILETRLYKLVGMEIGKLLDERAAKKKEAQEISRDLASPERLWQIIDRELAEVAAKYGDKRRTQIVGEQDAAALEYDPEEFVEHADTTVILSKQGWIRRIKSEVGEDASLKFREGDSLFGLVRVNTGKNVALFTNMGKVYVMRALDVPASLGFGEPIGSLLNFVDGEFVVGFIAPDPATDVAGGEAEEPAGQDEEVIAEGDSNGPHPSQMFMFGAPESMPSTTMTPDTSTSLSKGLVMTRLGKGFRFDYTILREATKRMGRRLVILEGEDILITARPEDGELVAVVIDTGNVLIFPVDQIPVMAGPARGVRMMKVPAGSQVIAMELVDSDDRLQIKPRRGKDKSLRVKDIPIRNRATAGKSVCSGILEVSPDRSGKGQV